MNTQSEGKIESNQKVAARFILMHDSFEKMIELQINPFCALINYKRFLEN